MSLPANFPSSLDILSNPTATTNRDDVGFELDLVIGRLQDIAEALEAKLGVGASTPASGGGVLRQTASGVSTWGKAVIADLGATGAAANTVLRTTDGATMTWGPALSGMLGTATLVPIANNTLSVAGPSIAFSGIPQTFAHILMIGLLRSAQSATSDTIRMTLNNTGTGYSNQSLSASAAAPGAFEEISTASGYLGTTAGATAVGTHQPFFALLPAYKGAIQHTFISFDVLAMALSTGNLQVRVSGGYWNNSGDITVISVFPGSGSNWAAFSYITLYGIPGAP